MLVEVKVPALSESVAEATLLSWHKREGEQVDRGENLIDIETDKVVLELPAPAAVKLSPPSTLRQPEPQSPPLPALRLPLPPKPGRARRLQAGNRRPPLPR